MKVYANNLNNLQSQLNHSNEINLRLKKDLQDLENAFKNFTIDNEKMTEELNKQRAIREDEEKNNNQLRLILGDRKDKLRNLNEDYIILKNMNDRRCEERNMLQMETDKLKQHIMILSKQNDDLSQEIDNIINEDNQMKNILNRSDRMSSMLKTNDTIVSQIPQDIYNCSRCCDVNKSHSLIYHENRMELSQSFERQRSLSPKYTYSRLEKNF